MISSWSFFLPHFAALILHKIPLLVLAELLLYRQPPLYLIRQSGPLPYGIRWLAVSHRTADCGMMVST